MVSSHRRPYRFAHVALVVLVVYWLVLVIATHLPRPPRLPSVSGIDKLAHLAAYALLGFLLALNFGLRRPLTPLAFIGMFAVLAVYGALDELSQIPVGRNSDLADWIADAAGVIVGLFCYWRVAHFNEDRRSKTEG